MSARARMGEAIRIVLVDESPAHRAMLRRTLQADGDIVVVAEASTYAGAAGAVARAVPDVVTMTSSLDGGEEAAIARIMRRTPRPILVVDARANGQRTAGGRRAIVAGAASVVGIRDQDEAETGAVLRRRIRALRRGVAPAAPVAARQPRVAAPAHRRAVPIRPVAPSTLSAPVVLGATVPVTSPVELPPGALAPVVAIASSTGGPSAVETVLRDIAGLPAAVLLVQHIDQRLVGGFADWLEKATGWPVAVAAEGTPPRPGVVTIGPGGRHLEVDARGLLALRDEPRTVHMPSGDRLFASLAAHVPDRTVATILTGMGADGAAGLLALRQAGARTIAQDEASSAVFGMARAAVELGAVNHLTPLASIGPAINRAVRHMIKKAEAS